MLLANSPGDLDYRSRECFRTWMIGRINEETALKKIKPLFGQADQAALSELSALAPGQFCLLREGRGLTIKSSRPTVIPQRVKDEKILELARKQTRNAS